MIIGLITLGIFSVVAVLWGVLYKPEGHPERKVSDEAQMKFLRELAKKEEEKCSK